MKQFAVDVIRYPRGIRLLIQNREPVLIWDRQEALELVVELTDAWRWWSTEDEKEEKRLSAS